MEETDLSAGGRRIKFTAICDGCYVFADFSSLSTASNACLSMASNNKSFYAVTVLSQCGDDESLDAVTGASSPPSASVRAVSSLSSLLAEMEECGAAPVLPDG